MGVLKAKVDGAWVEVGGGSGGGGDVLWTGPSAPVDPTIELWADTDEAAPPWNTILPNNQFLQGYRSDGTTVQGTLIGVSTDNKVYVGHGTSSAGVEIASSAAGSIGIGSGAQGDILIGSGMAAAKSIFVPRLTVQGDLTLQNAQWIRGVGSGFLLGAYETGTFSFQIAYDVNANHNFAGGMTTFHRNVDVKGTLTKGAVAYVHPDHVFEHAYTGAIEQFREAHGAQDYAGLLPLDAVERHTHETLRLPGPRQEKYDLFARGDEVLAYVEQIFLHLFALNRRIEALEAKL